MKKNNQIPNYHYGIIGNCTSSALISSEGSIDWLCLPFFDSASLFAKLVDEKKGGYFRIVADDVINITQSYVSTTPILKTVYETKTGIFEVRDYMPRFILEKSDYYCPTEIHRGVRPLSGKPRVRFELVPMPNYALGPAKLDVRNDYIKIMSTEGSYNSFYLYTNFDYESVMDSSKVITLDKPGHFLLSYNEKLEDVDNDKVYVEYEKTKSYWLDWIYNSKIPKKHRKPITRSLITLKLLMYEKTGAVIAAPTTSLPEIIGKDRNWDYRYCWVRDASMIVDLYGRLGDMRSATKFIRFILNRMLLKHENIAVMYGINGEKELEEKELSHLAGYESSKPVRIGNAAYKQKQNDLYGELIATIYTYFVINKQADFRLDEEIWTVVRGLVNTVIASWRDPDSGIWERRSDLHHYVHSKMMSWVAIDHAIKIARFVGKTSHIEQWQAIADEIAQDIFQHGWNDKIKSFSMYYGSDSLDAANLLMLHYGFLDKDDPKMISTVKQTYKHLVKDNFTFRYTEEDEFGLPENSFLVCSFWMANALYLIGEHDKARDMYKHISQYTNHLGLFSEDIEIASKRLTGNFPQGYSHLAFIQTTLLLDTNYNWSDTLSIKS